MTPQTAKDIAELGMTPEQMQERQSKLGEILHGSSDAVPHDKPGEPSMQVINSILGRAKKPRSDKGTTRPPKAVPEPTKAPAQTGVLTEEQASRLSQLSDSMIDAAINAEGRRREYYRFLNSLTASK